MHPQKSFRDSNGNALSRARQSFFEQGRLPEKGLLPDWLLQSWLRSNDSASRHDTSPVPLQREALRSRRDESGRLRHHALPELLTLAEMLQPSYVIVLLADARGMILDAAGNDAFMTKALRVALLPGVEWSEESRGTNAIGTALRESSAVTVLGEEHFLQLNTELGCTATPLIAPDGSVLGVLDVSGGPRCIQHQTMNLVNVVGRLIEHKVALDPPSDTEMLRFACDPAMLGSHREALLWIRDGRVVGANRSAQQELGMPLERLQELDLDAMFLNLPAVRQRGGMLELRPDLIPSAQRTKWPAAWFSTAGAPRMSVAAMTMPSQAEPPPVIDYPCRSDNMDRALRILHARIPVLIQGESGVGKEVFARQLHQSSERRCGPFVAINCAAIPEGLIESELFGYEDGAFTGARKRGQVGLIREADGGVLFLDEIGDMPLQLQARLLRVLQDCEVKPLGATRGHKVDFSLVCASHRNLQQLVDTDQFRADLFYRLQHFTVQLPPLRMLPERNQRIDELLARMLTRRGIALGADARTALLSYDWPGNWRQLVSLCQTLQVLIEPGRMIGLNDLPPDIARCALCPEPKPAADAAQPAPFGGEPLRDLTSAAIDAALAANDGNVSRAARQLGVSRSTLYRRKSR